MSGVHETSYFFYIEFHNISPHLGGQEGAFTGRSWASKQGNTPHLLSLSGSFFGSFKFLEVESSNPYICRYKL